MSSSRLTRYLPAMLWAFLTVVSIALRPLFPVDETRYVAVAWEMWYSGDFLVPHLNGETYSHKPPLLFWLMHLTWWIWGVNDFTPRLIAPLFSLASLYLVRNLAVLLWPGREDIADRVPYILLGFLFWMVYGTLTMFDVMLSFFALLGVYALALLAREGLSARRWMLLGVAIGGGVLTKGPVILLQLLPLALLLPWLMPEKTMKAIPRKQWHLGLLAAVLLGAAIPLCWAIPAGIEGGTVYRNAIFLGQTTGRMVDSFAHKLPVWWYLQLLPAILMPWLLFKPFWQGLARFDINEFGCRFCALWVLPVFVAFSLVSGKRIHYLLPLMPAVALLGAWALASVPAFTMRTGQIVAVMLTLLLGLFLAVAHGVSGVVAWQPELAGLSPDWGCAMVIASGLFARLRLAENTDWTRGFCAFLIVIALILEGGYFEIRGSRFDTAPIGKKIAGLMAENRPVAYYGGKYHGQFNFTGRLTQPLRVVSNSQALMDFARQNPDGMLVFQFRDSQTLPAQALESRFPFKGAYVGFMPCKILVDDPTVLSVLQPA